MENTILWAINIPEEPDSQEILYPVPSEKIGMITVKRLRAEAREQFPHAGECIAESVTLERWVGSTEEHQRYIEDNPSWWDETTFLDGEVA